MDRNMKISVSESVKKQIESRIQETNTASEDKLLDNIFDDTCRRCREDPCLVESIEKSLAGQMVILDNIRGQVRNDRHGRVVVSRKKTLEAAAFYASAPQAYGKHPVWKTAVLNSGSACHPCGCVPIAGLSQEEMLCRQSTLYACISSEECEELFYGPHRENFSTGHGPLMYNADLIYTPDVTVFKSDDDFPGLRPDWFNVDIITMSAPDIRNAKNRKGDRFVKQLVEELENRITKAMYYAAVHGAEVFIMDAFGCYLYANDPVVAAAAAARALGKMRHAFNTVEFAIYEKHTKKRFHVFRMVLDRYLDER